MPGSTTAPGWTGARNSAPAHVAFRHPHGVGTQNDVDFAAQWLAYAIPYRRFANTLADACARGYAYCAIDWVATNLLSSRFWPRQGFRPMVYRLMRQIDPRVLWAYGESDL